MEEPPPPYPGLPLPPPPFPPRPPKVPNNGFDFAPPPTAGDARQASRHHVESPWLQPPGPPPGPAGPGRLRLQTSMPDLRGPFYQQQMYTPSSAASPATFGPSTPVSAPPVDSNAEKSFWRTALSETRHLATGLLPPATESTKHYTILRHSSALVWYRGSATSVAITVFSDAAHPISEDRTVWMQQRGVTGDSGMKIKALMGATGGWIDVTPEVRVTVDVNEKDEEERARARDIARVASKSLREMGGPAKAHVPRETHVVRIPAVASDGYFRLAVCVGDERKRKVLCHSPVFRVASASADASVIRGASLSTLPIEMGVKVASVVASNAVARYTGPVVGIVQGGMDRLRPGLVAREAGRFVVGGTGRDKATGEIYYPDVSPGTRRERFGADETPRPIGPDAGPEAPFPVKFSGRVIPGTGRSTAELGMPTANLAGLAPEDVHHRLRGVYFGWAALDDPNAPEPVWHQCIITAGPPSSPQASRSVVVENQITAHLFHEFSCPPFFGAKLRVITMGFIRHNLLPEEKRYTLDVVSRDVILTVASLARAGWGPHLAVRQLREAKSARNLGERIGDVRDKVQRRVTDRVPLDVLGIRTTGQEARDVLLGRGGYWIKR
ncbi:hypothetical protein QBC47DRAFT_184324 [Echria macrotheca]|uniref:Riboflavin kinase n=1 Tax=Echria macrotheca TaxID=438768 RepID=A0AAJ0BDM2_9PEZI|nr:hypothetical protein QBC47DRAFT_184324 [Echria macrotheca]